MLICLLISKLFLDAMDSAPGKQNPLIEVLNCHGDLHEFFDYWFGHGYGVVFEIIAGEFDTVSERSTDTHRCGFC
jgi:hypothetical protein